MALRKALVANSGQVQQLQSGDFISGALVKTSVDVAHTIPDGYQLIVYDAFEVASTVALTIEDGGALVIL